MGGGMRLRNKKTGEMGIINYFDNQSIVIYPIDENWNAKGDKKYVYHSLTELNAEWEDYEEPKELEYYWYIGYKNDIRRTKYHHTSNFADNQVTETRKEIGNCFESLEEAEKALEKLKAWKRLKDKGFRFKNWESYEETTGLSFPDRHIVNSYTAIFDFNKPCRKYEIEKEVKADLDLLFGGEE